MLNLKQCLPKSKIVCVWKIACFSALHNNKQIPQKYAIETIFSRVFTLGWISTLYNFYF